MQYKGFNLVEQGIELKLSQKQCNGDVIYSLAQLVVWLNRHIHSNGSYNKTITPHCHLHELHKDNTQYTGSAGDRLFMETRIG